jgi:hypothetical protein
MGKDYSVSQSKQATPSGAAAGQARPAVTWLLARKVSFALVAILLFTLIGTASFAFYKFESVYSSLVQSRYSFVVFTIKKKVEDNLNFGFALRQIRQIQDVIEREKVRDRQVLGIEVFDANGEVLFDTDRGAIGTLVPDEWRASAGAANNQSFGHTDEDTLIVGLPLVNGLGKVEGGVVLRYPRAYLEHEVGGLHAGLAKDAVMAAGIFGTLAVVGLYVLFGTVRRKLDSYETTLASVMAVGGHAVAEVGSDDFEENFVEFVAKTREAVDHIRDATDEVGRLDRLA